VSPFENIISNQSQTLGIIIWCIHLFISSLSTCFNTTTFWHLKLVLTFPCYCIYQLYIMIIISSCSLGVCIYYWFVVNQYWIVGVLHMSCKWVMRVFRQCKCMIQ